MKQRKKSHYNLSFRVIDLTLCAKLFDIFIHKKQQMLR